MWLIVVKLDMALVIKSLLASECVARIFLCAVALTMKSMYFLYGWQPEILVRFALWLKPNTMHNHPDLSSFQIMQSAQLNPSKENIGSSSFLDIHQNGSTDNDFFLNSRTTTTNMNERENYLDISNNSYDGILEDIALSDHIVSVCSFPNSLDFFGNYCLATFIMFTTITR